MPTPEAIEKTVMTYRVLAERAQRRAEPITYGCLADAIGGRKFVRPISNTYLYVIAAHLLVEGLPPLTALVVDKKSHTTPDWLLRGKTFDHTLAEIYNHPWDPDLFNRLLT